MDKQNQTAGETAQEMRNAECRMQNETAEKATTNQFDAEIVRLKNERDERMAELGERIARLMAQNANMKTLRNLNQEQIAILGQERDIVGRDYKRRIAEITNKKNGFYIDLEARKHYERFTDFCDLHPEVLQMWKEFRQAEEGGEQ